MTVALTAAISILAVLLLLAGYYLVSQTVRGDQRGHVVMRPPVDLESDAFVRSLQGIAGTPVLEGNRCALLRNGEEIIPAMFEAIDAARSSVHFSSYIYWSGDAAERFAERLCDAAQRGVEVRVVLDWFGARPMDRRVLQAMESAGCEVRFFRAPRWFNLPQMNHRTHRRLLVVDGRIGFTGGLAVADHWMGDGRSPGHWRDSEIRVEGPAVGEIQRAFVDNWIEASGDILVGDRFFPPLDRPGTHPVCILQSDPSEASSTARRFMAACIALAQRSLHITNPYFVPNPAFVETLGEAARRGVDVKIIVPGFEHIDRPAPLHASRHTWLELLSAGVELYQYEPAMIHAKTIVADGCVAAIGSVNFDPRSFSINDECAVVVVDREIAGEMERHFEEDLEHCRRVTPTELHERRWTARLRDRAWYALRGQL